MPVPFWRKGKRSWQNCAVACAARTVAATRQYRLLFINLLNVYITLGGRDT